MIYANIFDCEECYQPGVLEEMVNFLAALKPNPKLLSEAGYEFSNVATVCLSFESHAEVLGLLFNDKYEYVWQAMSVMLRVKLPPK
jgi:hypothetical protein